MQSFAEGKLVLHSDGGPNGKQLLETQEEVVRPSRQRQRGLWQT